MLRKVLVMMGLVVLGIFSGACGDNGGGPAGLQRPTTDATQSEQAVAERYCDAVAATEKKGEELFSDIDQDDQKAAAEAERELLEFIQTTFPRGEELPDEIEEDFEAFLAGYELRVEEGIEPTKEQVAAEKRVLKWEEENCSK